MLDEFLGVFEVEGIERGAAFKRVACEVDDEFEAVVVFEGISCIVYNFTGGGDGHSIGDEGGELLAGIELTDLGKP
jgi:hypothetical protein